MLYNELDCFTPQMEKISVPIAKDNTYLCDEILWTVEETNGDLYDIKNTLNGKLVAILVYHEN